MGARLLKNSGAGGLWSNEGVEHIIQGRPEQRSRRLPLLCCCCIQLADEELRCVLPCVLRIAAKAEQTAEG